MNFTVDRRAIDHLDLKRQIFARLGRRFFRDRFEVQAETGRDDAVQLRALFRGPRIVAEGAQRLAKFEQRGDGREGLRRVVAL